MHQFSLRRSETAGHARTYFPALKPVTAAVAAALLAGYGVRTAWAGPTGDALVAGQATVSRPDAQTTVINQTSQRAAINWNGFSINVGEAVIFQQPSVTSVALNRVVGPNPSQIFGSLQANGQVILINPSGILFGRGASVDVGGLVASTLNISNNDFMNGRYVFSGVGGNVTVEQGARIRAGERGYVALLANQVSNSGTITASNGTVALGAGNDMVLDFNGDGLLSLKVNAAAAGAKIAHDGIIVANGGRVIMSAQARNALLDTVLNVDGIVQARGAVERNGQIYLEGGDSGVTRVAGTLDVSNAQGKGGELRVLGENVGLFGNAKLDASGTTGGGTVLVGGDYQGRNPGIANARQTIVGRDVTINADATVEGDGGKVIVWSDDTTRFQGNISARGGAQGGDGGFIEVSGKRDLSFTGSADAGAPRGRTGTLLLDPDTLIIDGGGPNNGGAGTDDDLADNQVLFAENAGGTTTVTEATLEALNANILLQAAKLIRTGSTPFIDGKLTIAPNRNLTLQTRNSTALGDTGGTHGIDLTNGGTNAPQIILQGSGTFTATTGFGDGSNNGDIAAPIVLSAIQTVGGSVTVRSNSTLTIPNRIQTRPDFSVAGSTGGNVFLTAGDAITIDAIIEASGRGATTGSPDTGGNGGEVLVRHTSGVANRPITLSGGQQINSIGGAAADASDTAGNGGIVTIVNESGNIVLNGSIFTQDGTLQTAGATAGNGGAIQLRTASAGNTITQGSIARLQTTQGAVSAVNGQLLVDSTGSVLLQGDGTNYVKQVAARVADAGASFSYRDEFGLTVTTVNAAGSQAGTAGLSNLSGVTTNGGAVDVSSNTTLTINQPIATTPTAGTGLDGGAVTLTAVGSITSTGAGTITTTGATGTTGANGTDESGSTPATDGGPGGAGGIGGAVLVRSTGNGSINLAGTVTARGASGGPGGTGGAMVAGVDEDGNPILVNAGTGPTGAASAGGSVTLRTDGSGTISFATIDTVGGTAAFSAPGGAGGAITLQGPVVLTTNASLTSAGGAASGDEGSIDGPGADIRFTSTLNGQTGFSNGLTINAGTGNLILQGVTGGATPLGSITITQATNIGGDATATTAAPAITAQSVDLTALGNVRLGDITTTGNPTLAPGNVQITAAAGIDVTGKITTAAPHRFAIAQPGGNVTFNTSGPLGLGEIDTSGNGADSIPGGSATGNIDFGSPNAITLRGNITARGGDGNSGAGTAGNGASLTFGAPVKLAGDVVVDTRAGTNGANPGTDGSVTFPNTVNSLTAGSEKSLTVHTSAATTFGAAIGAGVALASLTTDGGGTTAFNNGAAPSTGAVTSVTTTGAQTYNDTLTLGANTTMTSTGGGAITFGSTIQSGFDSVLVKNALATLAVNTSGTTTFSADINASGAELGGLSTGAGGTTVFGGAGTRTVTIKGAQTYSDAVVLNNDTVFQDCSCSGAPITFGSSINANVGATNRQLGISARANVTFSGNVGNVTPLAALSVSTNGVAGAAIVFNGASAQTIDASLAGSGGISLTGPVTLASGSNVTLNAGTELLQFTSTINGGGALTTTAGQTLFPGAIGNTTALSSLTTSGNVDLGAGTVRTTGAQTYNGALSLSNDTTLTSTAAGNVTFNNTVGTDGTARALTISTTGTTAFNDTVGAGNRLSSLTVSSGGPIAIKDVANSGTSIGTTGAQTYGGPVTLSGNVFLVSDSSGAINLAGTVDSTASVPASPLTVSTSGQVTFGGAVGGTRPLAALTTNGGGAVAVNGGAVTTNNAQSYDGTVTIGGASGSAMTFTGSSLNFGNASSALVAGNHPLTLTADALNFGGPVTGTGTLLIQPTADIVFVDVGGSGGTLNLTTLGQLQNGFQSITIGRSTATAATFVEPVTFLDPVTIRGLSVFVNGAITGNDNASITLTPTPALGGGIDLGANISTASNAVALNGPVTLTANATINTTTSGAGANVSFASTVRADNSSTQDRTLTVTAGTGTATFGGNIGVGSGAALADLDVTAGSIALNGSTINVNDSNAAAQTVTLNGPVVVGNDLTLSTNRASGTDSNLAFGGKVNGTRALTIDAGGGTVTFPDLVGDAAPLTRLDVTGATINIARGMFLNGGAVAQTGASANRFNGNVVLSIGNEGIDAHRLSGADSDVVFTGSIAAQNGDTNNRQLTVLGGALTFGGSIGAASGSGVPADALAGLTLGASRTIALNGSVINVNGGTVGGLTTSISGAVTLGTDVTINADRASGTDNNVNLIGTVDSSGGARQLVINAGGGTVSVNANVGAGASGALQSLNVTGGAIALNAPTINVNGGPGGLSTSFNGPVTLGADVTINADRASGTDNNVTFGGTVNGNNTTTGRALAVTAGNGTVTFNGVVGSTTSLSDFDVTAGNIAFNTITLNVNAPNAAAAPTVTLNGVTTLSNTSLTLSTQGHGGGAGSVTFGQIEGPGGLVVQAPADTVTFGGNVGATTPLPFLNATATRINLNAATFNLDGGAVSNGIVFSGPVFLGVPVVTIDADRTGNADSAVTFSSTIDADSGANNRVLNVNAGSTGSGIVTFGGAIGTSGALSGLTATAGTRIDLNAATYNINGGTTGGNTVAFNGPVQLNNVNLVSINTDRAGTTSDNNVSFGSTINSGGSSLHALDVNAGSGSVTFNGNVGATLALSNLTAAGSSINLNAPTFNLNGGNVAQNIAFNGPVTLGANVTVNTDRASGTDSSVTFGSSIGSDSSGTPRSLAVTAGNRVATFSGSIGSGAGVNALSDFDVTAASILFDAGAAVQPIVISSGAPTVVQLNGPVTVATQSLQLSTGGADVAFNGAVFADTTAGATRGLSVNAGTGTITFTADIGNNLGGAFSAASVTGGTINFNGSNIALNRDTAGGANAFSGALVLGESTGASVLITSDKPTAADGSLTFTSISGPSHPLRLEAGTSTINVSGATNVGALNATAGTAINLGPVTSSCCVVTLTSDSMALNGISAAGPLQSVALRNFSAGRTILLGGDSSTDLALNVAEINGITANTLIIGNATAGFAAGAITIANDVAPNVSTLRLFTGGGVTGTAGGIVMPSGALAINAGGAVNITDPQNDVGTLAAALTAGAFTFTDASALTIGVVDSTVTGVTTANAPVTITSAGNLTLSNAVNAGSGNVTLTSGNGAISGSALITGNNIALDSATGVGTGTGGRMNTSATSLAARSRTSGGVFVNETDGVLLQTLGTVQNFAAGSQGYDLVAGGAIAVSGPVSTANVNTSGTPGANATSGGINLTANGTITGAGPVTTGNATSSGGTATSGSINLSAQHVGTSSAARLDVNTGVASGGATNNQGQLAVSLTGTTAADGLFLSTSSGLRLAPVSVTANGAPVDIATSNGSTVTLAGNVSTIGGAVSLAAPVNLAGNVVVSAGNGAVTFAGTVQSPLTPRALRVTTSGLTTFGGAMGGSGNPLASLTTDGGGATALNAGAVTTTGAQTYNDVVTLGAATTLTSNGGGAIAFASTLDGAQALTVNTGGATTFGGAVGATTALASVTTNAGGTTAINGSSVTTTGNQTYGDDVTLGASTTLSGFNATFGGNVSGGGFDLALNFSGTTPIDGARVTGVRNLSTGNGGSTTLTGALTTSGTQTYGDAVTLIGDTTLAAGANAIAFGSTTDGAFNLAVNTTGATTFSGAVGGATALASLTTNAGGTTAINGGVVRTTGNQAYADNVTLGASTTLSGANATFSGNVSGGSFDLALNFSGTTPIDGARFTGIRNLSTGNGGTTALTGTVTTTGTQTYADTVTLIGDTTLAAGANAITLGSTTDGAFNLSVNTTGATTFSGAVGGTTALASLTTNAGGATAINGGVVRTTGNQAYNDAVTLGANATLTGATPTFSTVAGAGFDLTLNFTGTTAIDGATFTGIRNLASGNGGTTTLTGAVTTTGSQTYTDNVTLAGNTTLTGTTPTFGGTVTGGGNDLTLNFSGTTAIDGATFTGIRNLATGSGGITTLTGPLTTTGTQIYNDNVTLAGNTTLTGTTPTFGGTVTGGGNDLTLNFSGTTAIDGATFTGIRNLASGNGGTTTLTGALTTTGTQTYGDNVTLVGNTTLTGTTPTFGGTVTGAGNDLTLNFSGTTAIDGATFTGIRNLATGNGGTTTLTGPLTTTGTQTYNDNVTLAGNATLTGTTPTFGGTVTGAGNDLTLNFSGTTAIDGATFTGIRNLASGNGGVTNVTGALTTTGTQTFTDNVTLTGNATFTGTTGTFMGGMAGGGFDATLNFSGTTVIDGAAFTGIRNLTTGNGGITSLSGAVTTTGAQTYNDNVTLAGNTTLTGTTPTFGGTVTGGGNDLTLNFSGTTNIDGATFTGIRNLAAGNGGVTTLTGAITTTGTQTYADNVALAGNTTLTGTTPTFGGTVTGGGNDLTLNFSGTTAIDGATFTGIRALTTGNGGTTSLTGALTTSGNQTYNDNVTLAGNTALNAGAGSITFAGTLESPATARALTVTAANTRFGGAVGGNGNTLASLTASGNVRIDGGVVTTIGTQTYNNAVVIGANTALNSTAGNMTFGGALDADAAANNRTLLVNAPTGTVTISGNVGASAAFADFDVISGPNTIVFNGAAPQTVNVTAGSGGNTVSFTGNVRLDQSLTINTGGSANNSVRFNNGVDPGGGAANRALAVNAGSGDVTFQAVGNATPLALLDVNGSTIAFNARTVGNQIVIGANQVLTDPATGLIQALLPFSGFNGPAALTLNGPASGGIFGTENNMLHVDLTGLLVVTPNDRTLPTVWLQGDPTRRPQYQFYGDPFHRDVVYEARPIPLTDPQQTREILRRADTDLLEVAAEEVGVATAEGRLREPLTCIAAGSGDDSALACAESKQK